MNVLAHVIVLDREGLPKDIDLRLEAYDVRTNAWRAVDDILKAFRTSPKITRNHGRHEISFTLREAAFLELFGATAFFRLVSQSSGPESTAAHVLLTNVSVSSDGETFDAAFGTVLFLGKEHGFYTALGKDEVFCSGVSLASDDAKLAAAQRRFYTNPYEVGEVAADRDRMRDLIGRLEATNATLERSLAQCQAERSDLAQKNAGLEEKLAVANRGLAACTAERGHLTEQLATCSRDREAAVAQIETLRRQLAATASELRQILEARQKAEADLSSCRERAGGLERQVAECAAALEASSRAKAEIETRAVAAERERDAQGDRASALEEERRLLVAELKKPSGSASDERGDVESLRIQLVTEKATASAATQKLELLRAQQRSEVPAEALFKNLARCVGDATRHLATESIPYRIGRVDFKLKTFVSADGGKMFLADAAHMADNPALSDVSIELIPDEVMAPREDAVTVPDVSGLTETAAIRALASLSLKAEKAIETVTNQPDKHGRALRQIPKAGAPATKGDTILVVYGAEKGGRDE